MSNMDIKQIMEIIPHRQPFLLIDAIEELEPGVRAVAKKCVSYNEPYFAGCADYRGYGAGGSGGDFKQAGKQGQNGIFCRNQ